MGAFYGSIHIKADEVAPVREALDDIAKRKWKFLVSPVMDGWIAVYPNVNGQDERVSKALAKKLDWPILHVAVHDDDVFYYWYYRGGKLIDRFSSCPEYFGQISARMKSLLHGKPERVADILQHSNDLNRLTALVEEMRTEPLYVSDRPEQFAKLFGLSNFSTAYEYLMADETDGIEQWDEFVHVPDLSEERRDGQEAAARVQRQKDRLKDEGKLLAELSMGKKSSKVPVQIVWCVDSTNGLLVAQPNIIEQREVPVQMLQPPWAGNLISIGIMLQPTAFTMQTSPSGTYLAVGYAGRTQKAELWDVQQKKCVLEIEHTSVVYSVAFALDETVLFTMSPQEIVVTDLSNYARTGHWKIENGQSIDLHSSGKMIALAKQDGFSILNTESGEERAIRLGRYQDLSGLRELLQGQLQQEMENIDSDWVSNQVQKTLKQLGVPEDSAAGKRMRAETEKGFDDMLSGKAFAHFGERTFQPEHVRCAKFVGDGKYLACATEAALRVFDIDHILSASGDDVEPLYSVEPTKVPSEYGYLPGNTFTVVDGVERGSILFAGLDGTIRSLELGSGVGTELFSPPGTPPIMQMQLVGKTLFCLCQPGFPEIHGKRQPPLLQIWDVGKLAG